MSDNPPGERFRLRQASQIPHLMEQITRLQQQYPMGVDVVYQPVTDARTTDQNAMLWAMFDQFARTMNRRIKADGGDFKWDKRLVHDMALGERFGVATTILPDGRKVTRYPRSSRLSKEAMTRFIDWFEAWAQRQGVVLDRPANSSYHQYREANE